MIFENLNDRKIIRLATVLGNSVNDITPRASAGRTCNDEAPPRAPYLSPDAEIFSAELPSLTSAGNLAQRLVNNWLLSRTNADAVEFLGAAAHDFAKWFATHDGHDPFTITVGWEDPRVLITLQDRGTEYPDLRRSRRDAAMIHRILGHYVTEWECEPNAAGARTARIYGDITASKDTDSEDWDADFEEWPQ
jgi:hypothetical protein